MPDVFGNPTLQEMTTQRQRAFQGQIGDIMQSNMARAQTGADKAGVGVGSFLGALASKYLGTPYAETEEAKQYAARDQATKDAIAPAPTDVAPNSVADLQQRLEGIRKYNSTDYGNAESIAFERQLTKDLLAQTVLEKDNKELQANVTSFIEKKIPEDLIQGYASGDLTYKDVLDTNAERAKPEDAYVTLTAEEAQKRGIKDLSRDYQLNTKDNKISVLGGNGTTVNVGKGEGVTEWNTVVDNYRQDTKSILEDSDKVDKVKAALRANSSAGSVATQQSISELFGSSVRAQAELNKWAKLGNLGERVSGSITKFFSGTYTPEALNDISRLVATYEDSLGKRQNSVNEKYNRISTTYGINPADVIVEPVLSPRYDFDTMQATDLLNVNTQDLLPHQLQDFSERASKLREQIEQGRNK